MRDVGFDCFSHAKVSLCFHLVLATKYRRACLFGLEDVLCDCVCRTLEDCGCSVLAVGVGHGDHLHVVFRVRRLGMDLGGVVARVKQQSTFELWRDYCDVLSRFYRGREHRLWSSGYFLASVGHDTVNVLRYVRNQDE